MAVTGLSLAEHMVVVNIMTVLSKSLEKPRQDANGAGEAWSAILVQILLVLSSLCPIPLPSFLHYSFSLSRPKLKKSQLFLTSLHPRNQSKNNNNKKRKAATTNNDK